VARPAPQRARTGRRLAGALLGAALALAACRSHAPTGRVAEGHAGAPDVRVFLLCPVNLVVALQPEFEGGVEPAQAALVAYVEAHGRRVARLSLQQARDLWLRAVAAAKAAGERRF
jgi:hypothetical protein